MIIFSEFQLKWKVVKNELVIKFQILRKIINCRIFFSFWNHIWLIKYLVWENRNSVQFLRLKITILYKIMFKILIIFILFGKIFFKFFKINQLFDSFFKFSSKTTHQRMSKLILQEMCFKYSVINFWILNIRPKPWSHNRWPFYQRSNHTS